MNVNLTGKTAVVCGSTKGIGKAIAYELASMGAGIVLFARDRDAMKKITHELDTSAGQEHTYLKADFRFPEDVGEVIREYASSAGSVHILVNNSGGPPPGTAFDAHPQDFVNAFLQHLVSYQHIVQALVPLMKKQHFGRIINVISTSVRAPIPGLGVSNTIRGAVASWAKTLSRELGPFGITVNNILPGYTATDRLSSLIEARAKERGVSYEALEEEMKNSIPARRFADPSETAALAAFLASESAAFINGESIRIDGGATPSI